MRAGRQHLQPNFFQQLAPIRPRVRAVRPQLVHVVADLRADFNDWTDASRANLLAGRRSGGNKLASVRTQLPSPGQQLETLLRPYGEPVFMRGLFSRVQKHGELLLSTRLWAELHGRHGLEGCLHSV